MAAQGRRRGQLRDANARDEPGDVRRCPLRRTPPPQRPDERPSHRGRSAVVRIMSPIPVDFISPIRCRREGSGRRRLTAPTARNERSHHGPVEGPQARAATAAGRALVACPARKHAEESTPHRHIVGAGPPIRSGRRMPADGLRPPRGGGRYGDRRGRSLAGSIRPGPRMPASFARESGPWLRRTVGRTTAARARRHSRPALAWPRGSASVSASSSAHCSASPRLKSRPSRRSRTSSGMPPLREATIGTRASAASTQTEAGGFLPDRWDDERVGGLEQCGDPVRTELAADLDVLGDVQRDGLPAKLVLDAALDRARHDQGGVVAVVGAQVRQGSAGDLDSLLSGDAPDEQDRGSGRRSAGSPRRTDRPGESRG